MSSSCPHVVTSSPCTASTDQWASFQPACPRKNENRLPPSPSSLRARKAFAARESEPEKCRLFLVRVCSCSGKLGGMKIQELESFESSKTCILVWRHWLFPRPHQSWSTTQAAKLKLLKLSLHANMGRLVKRIPPLSHGKELSKSRG